MQRLCLFYSAGAGSIKCEYCKRQRSPGPGGWLLAEMPAGRAAAAGRSAGRRPAIQQKPASSIEEDIPRERASCERALGLLGLVHGACRALAAG